MNNLVMIDKDNISKFGGLYSGNIEDNFNENSICYGYIEKNSEGKIIPVGLLMADVSKRSFLITWAYVVPEYREQYVMYSLMGKLIENAKNSNIIKSIYCVTTSDDFSYYLNTQFGFYRNFYEENGVMTSRVGELIDLSAMARGVDKVKPVREIEEVYISKLNRYFAANPEIPVGVDLPLNISDYSELSMGILEDGEIKALILLEEKTDSLIVSYAYAKEGSGHLMMKIVVALQEKFQKFPADWKIVAAVLNDQSENLFSRLFNEYEYEKLYENELFL